MQQYNVTKYIYSSTVPEFLLSDASFVNLHFKMYVFQNFTLEEMNYKH